MSVIFLGTYSHRGAVTVQCRLQIYVFTLFFLTLSTKYNIKDADSYCFNRHIKTTEQQTIIRQYSDWYTGFWWVGCYIWYSEEGPGWAAARSSSLLLVRNVTSRPSVASVPTSYYGLTSDFHLLLTSSNVIWKLTFSSNPSTPLPCCPPSDCQRLWFSITAQCACIINTCIIIIITRGQSNLTKRASRGAIPRLGVTPGGRKLYHWIPGVGFPISVP